MQHSLTAEIETRLQSSSSSSGIVVYIQMKPLKHYGPNGPDRKFRHIAELRGWLRRQPNTCVKTNGLVWFVVMIAHVGEVHQDPTTGAGGSVGSHQLSGAALRRAGRKVNDSRTSSPPTPSSPTILTRKCRGHQVTYLPDSGPIQAR